jgi:hypothetical protein
LLRLPPRLLLLVIIIIIIIIIPPDGREILKWIFRQWDGSMDWVDLAQNRDR